MADWLDDRFYGHAPIFSSDMRLLSTGESRVSKRVELPSRRTAAIVVCLTSASLEAAPRTRHPAVRKSRYEGEL